MLRHFDNIKTPLHSVRKYPTVKHQEQRFAAAGWEDVRCWTHWQAWADDLFLNAETRRALDKIEPFDEWEEFALFASHYVLLLAAKSPTPVVVRDSMPSYDESALPPLTTAAITLSGNPRGRGRRRFSAPMLFKSNMGEPIIAHFLGAGQSGRLSSYDVFTIGGDSPSLGLLPKGPASRQCYTLTSIGDGVFILAGGRTSPSAPLSDSWIFRPDENSWHRASDLPAPLYRHSATRLGSSRFLLLMGGKVSSSSLFDGQLVRHPEHGWLECSVSSAFRPAATFGGLLVCTPASAVGSAVFKGIYAGGLTADGLIPTEIVSWELDLSDSRKPLIRFEQLPILPSTCPVSSAVMSQLCRFGATSCQQNTSLLVVGGVAAGGLASWSQDILLVKLSNHWSDFSVQSIHGVVPLHSEGLPRRLFLGSSAVWSSNGSAVILGGGATIFSWGAVWNHGTWNLSFQEPLASHPAADREWGFWQTVDVVSSSGPPASVIGAAIAQKSAPVVSTVPRVKLGSSAQFLEILRDAQPVILDGLTLGTCLEKWDNGYLLQRVGADREAGALPRRFAYEFVLRKTRW
jgi:tRNA wybutosine-synthesizing protein 4